MSDLIGSVPNLPKLRELESPQVVLVMDKIRRDLDHRSEFEEFCLFAQQYPRCYRLHLDGAAFRVSTIHKTLNAIHKELSERVSKAPSNLFEVGVKNKLVYQLYWDFESYLSEINIALDLLARVVGAAFKQQSPPSFNKLCKQKLEHVLLDQFRTVQRRWVSRLKDYRDCFFHCTPVDYFLAVVMLRYSAGWELQARLPINPNVREMLGFRFSRRVDLLRYSIATFKHMIGFDRAVAETILKLYRGGDFPVRKDHLFFLGQRGR